MPVNTKELLDGIAILTDEQNMRVTIKQTTKGALVCGASCFIGGLVLGPVGLAIGGAAGGMAAMQLTKGTFKSVGDIIRYDLTDRERAKLLEHIQTAVSEFQPADLAMLLPLIMGNPSIQQAVFKTVVSFISNEMRLQIVD